MQLPEGNAHMDGPGEATYESAWPADFTWPRKRGPSRVFAEIQSYLTASFRGGLRSGLYLLLHL